MKRGRGKEDMWSGGEKEAGGRSRNEERREMGQEKKR